MSECVFTSTICIINVFVCFFIFYFFCFVCSFFYSSLLVCQSFEIPFEIVTICSFLAIVVLVLIALLLVVVVVTVVVVVVVVVVLV